MGDPKLLEDLGSTEPGLRLQATRRIAEEPAWDDPLLVARNLADLLDDPQAEVRCGAVQALGSLGGGAARVTDRLTRAMLADERLVDDGIEALRAIGPQGVEPAALPLMQTLARGSRPEAMQAAARIVERLTWTGLFGEEQRETARACLISRLQSLPRALLATTIELLLALGQDQGQLMALCESAQLQPEDLAEARRRIFAPSAEATADHPPASDVGRTIRILPWVLAGVVASPFVFCAVVLFPEFPLATAIGLGLVALVVSTVAFLWWRCPACKRPFAGRLVHRALRSGTGTATVRGTDGRSYNVQRSTVRVVRTYRCRHCGEVFLR